MTARRAFFGEQRYMDATQAALRAAGPRCVAEGWNVRYRAALERMGLTLMPLQEATERGMMGYPGCPLQAPRPVESPDWWRYPHPSVIVEKPNG